MLYAYTAVYFFKLNPNHDSIAVTLPGMPYQISLTDVAATQLRAMTAHDRRIIESAIAARLTDQPTTVTKCVRKLRPNSLAEFELRIQRFRVLYNVDVETDEIVLLIVGIKLGNKLIVEGTEFHGHRSDPPQPSAE